VPAHPAAAEPPRRADDTAQAPSRVVRGALGTWLLSRVSVLVLAVAGWWTLARVHAGQLPGLLQLWDRWDVRVFAKIAQFGYLGYPRDYPDTGTGAFFPGMPGALWVVHSVTRDWVVAGLLISLVAGGAAAVALARLAAAEHGGAAGTRSVLYLVVSPFAVFLAAGYSEALFLAFAITAWVAARQQRWLLAGVLGGLAGTVRVTGLFLGAALIVEWFSAGGRRWRDLPPLLLPWAAVAGFVVYLHAITGDWLAWQHVQAEEFARRLVLPWEALQTTWAAAGDPNQPAPFAWSFGGEVAAMAVGVVLTVVLLVRRSWGEAMYVGGQLVALATSSFYASVARATLLWWPLWVLLAVAAGRWRWVHAVYLALAVPLCAAGVLAFTQGQWVG
jgi:hypothetical protein